MFAAFDQAIVRCPTGRRKLMKNLKVAIVSMAFACLLYPPVVSAQSEGECTNPAVPRTTPSSDFELTGNGTIVHHLVTGLEWQRCMVGQGWDDGACTGFGVSMTWPDALQAAADAGDGWRLPHVNELRSIIEDCRTMPAINRDVFPGPQGFQQWSASPFAGHPFRAWTVDLGSGEDNRPTRDSTVRFRLVRDKE